MQFRLVWYNTRNLNKYNGTDTDSRHEFIGSRQDIWSLWFNLVKIQKFPHVDVYNLEGTKLEPENGINAMIGYSL